MTGTVRAPLGVKAEEAEGEAGTGVKDRAWHVRSCFGTFAALHVKKQSSAESLASSGKNKQKQTFQAGTREVGGRIRKQQQDQARTNEFKAHYPSSYTHPHLHIHIPYSHYIDLIAHTRKAASQHTFTKLCFHFLPLCALSVCEPVPDVTSDQCCFSPTGC